MFVHLIWMVRWEVSCRTAAVLWNADAKIWSKQNAAFLYAHTNTHSHRHTHIHTHDTHTHTQAHTLGRLLDNSSEDYQSQVQSLYLIPPCLTRSIIMYRSKVNGAI